MDYDKNKFLNILDRLKKFFGSQNKMAEELGLSSSYITKIYDENTKNPPAPEYLQKIATNSKGITTYDELMEICGYKEESLETIAYNTYLDIKKFTLERDADEYNCSDTIYSCLEDFQDYIKKLKNNLNSSLHTKILFNTYFKEEDIIEDYLYVSNFLYVYNTLISYLKKKEYVELSKYNLINWLKTEDFYNNISVLNDLELLSYTSQNIKFIDINNNKNDIINILNTFNSYINMAYLSDVDNNEITQFFKEKVLKNKDTNVMVAEESIPYPTSNIIKIPVVGTVAAGEPILAQENIIDYEELPANEFQDGEYFRFENQTEALCILVF